MTVTVYLSSNSPEPPAAAKACGVAPACLECTDLKASSGSSSWYHTACEPHLHTCHCNFAGPMTQHSCEVDTPRCLCRASLRGWCCLQTDSLFHRKTWQLHQQHTRWGLLHQEHKVGGGAGWRGSTAAGNREDGGYVWPCCLSIYSYLSRCNAPEARQLHHCRLQYSSPRCSSSQHSSQDSRLQEADKTQIPKQVVTWPVKHLLLLPSCN